MNILKNVGNFGGYIRYFIKMLFFFITKWYLHLTNIRILYIIWIGMILYIYFQIIFSRWSWINAILIVYFKEKKTTHFFTKKFHLELQDIHIFILDSCYNNEFFHSKLNTLYLFWADLKRLTCNKNKYFECLFFVCNSVYQNCNLQLQKFAKMFAKIYKYIASACTFWNLKFQNAAKLIKKSSKISRKKSLFSIFIKTLLLC